MDNYYIIVSPKKDYVQYIKMKDINKKRYKGHTIERTLENASKKDVIQAYMEVSEKYKKTIH